MYCTTSGSLNAIFPEPFITNLLPKVFPSNMVKLLLLVMPEFNFELAINKFPLFVVECLKSALFKVSI